MKDYNSEDYQRKKRIKNIVNKEILEWENNHSIKPHDVVNE